MLLLIAAFCSGCPRNQYVIELNPAGSELQRKLTCWREDGVDNDGRPKYVEFPKDELSALKDLFGSEESDGKTHRFSGRFGTAPNDIGGRGSYTVYETSLGTACVYVERFRGRDDLHGSIQRRLQAADDLVDLLVGWSKKEIGEEPAYQKLEEFLKNDFRKDARNLALYIWTGGGAESRGAGQMEEFWVRMAQYLVEREYFTAADLPQLAAADENPRPTLLLIQRWIATKLGVPHNQALPARLAFLADGAAAEASLSKYLEGTAQFKQRVKEFEAKGDPNARKPEPLEIPQELLAIIVHLPAGEGGDHLALKLALPSAPSHTNGKWNQRDKQLVWEGELESKPGPFEDLPFVCYASWSVPNEQTQKQRFGKTFLNGKGLLDYCLAAKMMSASESQEWEKFVASLSPGAAGTKIQEFHFSSEAAAGNGNLEGLKQILLKALEG